MKILLKIAYLGTAYCGYQVQPNGITVQEVLGRAAEQVFGVKCDIVGCSRTDSGVHARGFCATVTAHGKSFVETTIPTDRLPRVFNLVLPPDISVLSAVAVPDTFHARYDVASKEYEYLIHHGAERSPFLTGRAWQMEKPFSAEAVAAMHKAAQGFVGRHDFSAVRDKADDEKDAVRQVFSASVTAEGNLISFRVRADGFLYHMVRIMTGTLVAVGRGKIPPESIAKRLASLDRTAFGVTAPPDGLYLDSVMYHHFEF